MESIEVRRKIADELGCYIAEDVLEIAQIKQSTLDYWRMHGTGPEYIIFGKAYLFPKAKLAEHVMGLLRTVNKDFVRSCI